jgi:galactokinase
LPWLARPTGWLPEAVGLSLSTHRVQELFRKAFGHTAPRVVRAPGRLEVLGNHTDYNEGLVMSVAIDRWIEIASTPRTDGRIELVTSAYPERESFPVTRIEKNPEAPWADYVKGVLLELRRVGVHFSGFSAAIHSTISTGAGMSSSAALEVAIALTVRQLYPFSLNEMGRLDVPPSRDRRGRFPPLAPKERLLLARLCQAAENRFVGVQCGLLDQVSSLCGKAHHVMNIDFRLGTVELAPLLGEVLVVCESGVKHALVGGEYNELRRHCESAARALGAKSLRSVEMPYLKANRARLTEREYECAYHVVGEIQRVVYAERALREGDNRQFGQYLYQSHESSRDHLRNSCAELDLLVELAGKHRACLGSRLTGGGFGGATISLVAYHEVEDFMTDIAAAYAQRTGHSLRPVVCQIVDGAG